MGSKVKGGGVKEQRDSLRIADRRKIQNLGPNGHEEGVRWQEGGVPANRTRGRGTLDIRWS